MAYSLSGYGAKDVTMSDLEIGVSTEGMEQYRSNIHQSVIIDTFKYLEDTQGISDAITAGWQGESRDKFLQQFGEMIKKIEEDLQNEYNDLSYRLQELESNYFEQDKNMIED